MKTISTRLLLFLLVSINLPYALGQADPNLYIPPSPNASAMMRYGSIPVNLYTGTANISVPLYDLKGRDVSVPIMLNYQASGIKVQDVASSVGLGWNLNAGGAITRLVRGRPDGEVSNCTSDMYWGPAYGQCDAESDIYYFSFLGRTGQMYLMTNGTPATMPYQDLKITVTGTISSGNWHWTITDESGYQYVFGENSSGSGRELTTYYTQNPPSSTYVEKDTFIATWYLEKVISPLGENVVTFTYEQGANVQYDNYAQKRIYVTSSNCGSGYPKDLVYNTNTRIKTTAAKYIKIIQTSLGSATFNYNDSRSDLTGGRSVSQVVIKDINDIVVKKYLFTYSYHPRIAVQGGGPDRLRLDKINEDFNTTSPYRQFEYDYAGYSGIPPRVDLNFDHWGYYNGSGNNSRIPGSGTADRSPDSDAAKMGILKNMIYPTGGYTQFLYGSNGGGGLRIASITNYDGTTVVDKREYTYEGQIVFRTPVYSYSYSTSSSTEYFFGALQLNACDKSYTITNSESFATLFDINGASSGYSKVTETILDGGKIEYEFTNYTGAYADAGPYSNKYKGPDDQHTNFESVADGNGPPFSSTTTKFWLRGLPTKTKVFDNSGNKLSEEEIEYDPDATTTNTRLSYPTESSVIEDGDFIYHRGSYALYSQPVQIKYKWSYVFPQSQGANPTSSVFEKSTFYYHVNHKTFPGYISSQQGTNGPITVTNYRYPSDLTTTSSRSSSSVTQPRAEGVWRMVDHNMIVPIEIVNSYQGIGGTMKIIGAKLLTYTTDVYYKPLPYEVYALRISAPISNLSTLITLTSNGTVLSFDPKYQMESTMNYSFSNAPTSAVSGGGITTNLNWGYNYSLLSSSTSNPGTNQMTTEYTYKPLVGLIQQKDPNNLTTSYEYDSKSRLKLTRDQGNNITSRYRYHYRNENEFQADFSVGGEATTGGTTSFVSSNNSETIGVTRYLWDFGDGQIVENGSDNVTYNYSTPGVKTVKFSKINPEYGSVTMTKQITITSISVGVNNSGYDLCNYQSNQWPTAVINVSSGGCSNITYEWFSRQEGYGWGSLGSGSSVPIYGSIEANWEVKCVITDHCNNITWETGPYYVSFYKSDPNCYTP